MAKLTRAALDYLAKRGITTRAAAKRRFRMIVGEDAKAIFGATGVGRTILGMPYFTPDRKPLLNLHAPFLRGRILETKLRAGPPMKGMKFVQPEGTLNHLYFDPARNDWAALLADPKRPLVVTEGEIKAMCATEHGVPAIAVGGVWSWRTRINGRSVPLPELDGIVWAGRAVLLAFDSDAGTNPEVMAALYALALDLTKRGAKVEQIVIPAADDGAKVGLDDFLVVHNSEGLAKLPRVPVSLVLDHSAPTEIARAFVGANHTAAEGVRTLHHHAGLYCEWRGSAYAMSEEAGLRAALYEFANDGIEKPRPPNFEVRPFRATKPRIDQILDALRAVAHLAADRPPPRWLDDRTTPKPDDLIPMANGLLHVPTRKLVPPDPRFFATNALEFAYDPKPPKPEAWFKFLADLWPDDPEAVAALQEFFGYTLTPETCLQKILMIVGPKRSGKGTMARIHTALVGAANVRNPTLADFAQHFGIQTLIGKSLAIITDARLGARTDLNVVTERLLSISGEDSQSVNRKFLDAWNGRLNVRFVILTNELPRFTDASGALPSRLIILRLQKTFYGHEDLGLADRLLGELPGILVWALDGLDRLRRRGHFIPPKSSEEMMSDLEDLASPVGAFVRDLCDVGVKHEIGVEKLYATWNLWCEKQGRYKTNAATFGRDLHAAYPGIERIRTVIDGVRRPVYRGIGLRPAAVAALFGSPPPADARKKY